MAQPSQTVILEATTTGTHTERVEAPLIAQSQEPKPETEEDVDHYDLVRGTDSKEGRARQ